METKHNNFLWIIGDVVGWFSLAAYIATMGYIIGKPISEAIAKPAGLELKVLSENRDSALISIQGEDYCLKYDSESKLEDYSKCECKQEVK